MQLKTMKNADMTVLGEILPNNRIKTNTERNGSAYAEHCAPFLKSSIIVASFHPHPSISAFRNSAYCFSSKKSFQAPPLHETSHPALNRSSGFNLRDTGDPQKRHGSFVSILQ